MRYQGKMRSLKEIFNYAFGSATRNTENTVRAGRNNNVWGIIGGAVVGAVIGSVAFPIGTILGLFVGGLLGSTVSFGTS